MIVPSDDGEMAEPGDAAFFTPQTSMDSGSVVDEGGQHDDHGPISSGENGPSSSGPLSPSSPGGEAVSASAPPPTSSGPRRVKVVRHGERPDSVCVHDEDLEDVEISLVDGDGDGDDEEGRRRAGSGLSQEEEERLKRGRGWLFDGTSRALYVVFPKLQPLPWHSFFVLSFLAAIPAAVYVLFFTSMGFGLTTMYYLSTNFRQYTPVIFLAIMVIFLLLYLLDSESWTSKLGRATRAAGIASIVAGIFAWVLFLAGEYPYGPICLFVVGTPIWMVGTKFICYRRTDARVYVSWLSGPLFFVSIVTGLTWMAWTFARDENEWNQSTRLADVETAGCQPNFETYPECEKEGTDGEVCFVVDSASNSIDYEGCPGDYCAAVYDDCMNTFILWVGPLLMGVSLFFLSFFCTFLRSDSREEDLLNFAKLWIFLLFAMWVAASLAGAGPGIMMGLTALTLAAFVGSGVLLSITYGKLSETERGCTVMKRLSQKYASQIDVARGLLVVTCSPVALAYLALSFVNQCVRRTRLFPCSVKASVDHDGDGDSAHSGWLTKKASDQVREFKKWDRAKVYTYAVYWGIAFMTLSVIVAQFTLVFMSWLIEQTQALPLAAVTLIMVGVGLLMFLLPPVPGVPIYLTLGIVTIAAGREILGIVGSMAYCAAVSLLLKLGACALQQKLIGESLSKYVSVRQLVGVNTHFVRSMKLVLSKPGLSVPKVSILIGGPDWPTSVLCGIMRLGLFQILVGTLPIIFLILPTMLTGSFAYLASLKLPSGVPEFPWAGTVGTICAAVTAIVQFGSMLVAAYYLEKAASSNTEELEKMPFDEEVRLADDKASYRKKLYSNVTQWKAVPTWAKAVLLLSVGTMVTCCYMVQLFSEHCFVDYELTSTVSEDLNGNVANLVKPLGWVAIGLFLFSCCLLKIFTGWATTKANKIAKDRVFSFSLEKSEQKQEAADGDNTPTTVGSNTVVSVSMP